MLRVLPIAAVVAATVVLVPATASATPASSRVTTSESFSATTEIALPDGTQARVTLGEFRSGVRGAWTGQLTVETWSSCDQPFGCPGGRTSGYAALTDADVEFTRSLSRAAALDVPVTLRGGSTGPGTGTEKQVTVSVAFTGTGPVTRTVDHSDVCGDTGEPGCLSIRRSAHRDAATTVTIDAGSGEGIGSIDHAVGVDVSLPGRAGTAAGN